jgi:hypothetical protein
MLLFVMLGTIGCYCFTQKSGMKRSKTPNRIFEDRGRGQEKAC